MAVKITEELKKSLEGITEDELKRAVRKIYRAKAERERNPAHKPTDVPIETAPLNASNNAIRYALPKRQDIRVGKENYEGQESLTDKLGYMPLLDRLLQMQRGGESLAQLRAHMAEYNIEMRKELEKAAKLHADDWPAAIDSYIPDIAQIQQMQKDAQYRVAARSKARQEEIYRAKAMEYLTKDTDVIPKIAPEKQPEQPEG